MSYRQPLVWLIILALSPAVISAKRPKIIELDRIVATVNSDVITQSQLNKKVGEIKSQLRAQKTQIPSDDILNRKVLESMILQQIQLQIAKRKGIKINDEQLTRTIENIAQQNGVDIQQFRVLLEKEGYSFSYFREQIRNEMIIAQLQKQEVTNRVQVSAQEVDNQIALIQDQITINEEYHLGHIFISVPESATVEQITAAQQTAEKTVSQIRFGADFEQTAITVSNGQNALKGGDIGWQKKAALAPAVVQTIEKLQIGGVSNPIRSSSGFHIFKLIEKRQDTRKHIVDQTFARHILIVPNQITTHQQAKEKLERIRERVLSGEDFATLAKASSEDKGSAVVGGDLGWTSKGDLVAEFEEQMIKLKPGEISPPFRSRYGWHIVQVMSRRKHDDTESYIRSQARISIHNRKSEEELQNWLRQIRDDAYIEIHLDN